MAKKIMVVDDSNFIYHEMKFRLGDHPAYEIAYYCPDGEQLIAAYEEHQPDLVTIDIIMPGIDGIDAARALLQRHPEARVLMVSSLAFDETIEQATAIGALGFLAKPFEQEQMIASLDAAFLARP